MRKTRPIDNAFKMHCINKKIFINNSSLFPDNMNKIITKLASNKLSSEKLGFTIEKFERFKSRNLNASINATIISTIFSVIIGDINVNINGITANDFSFYNL